MTRATLFTLAAAASLAAAGGAAAQGGRLYISGPTGGIMTSLEGSGEFRFLGLCSGAVQAMVVNGRELLLADTSGFVYRFDLATEQILGFFEIGTPATALAMHNGALVVGAATGPVRRLDPVTGAVLSTFTAPAGGVHAMTLDGSTLFTGSHNTLVMKGSPMTGGFQMLTACGGAVDAAAISHGELVLGTTGTTVYRINAATGAYYGTFQMDRPQIAVVPGGQHLIVAHADGLVRRVNQTTGAVLQSWQAPIGVEAMVIDSCVSDINNDGKLTIADFGAFQTSYVLGDLRMDFNDDGFLSVADFGAFQSAYSVGCP